MTPESTQARAALLKAMESTRARRELLKDMAGALEPQVGAVLAHGSSYTRGAVRIEKFKGDEGPLFRIFFGDREMGEPTPELERAVSSMVHYLMRRCTSCGSEGCSFDFNPQGKSVVELLPCPRPR